MCYDYKIFILFLFSYLCTSLKSSYLYLEKILIFVQIFCTNINICTNLFLFLKLEVFHIKFPSSNYFLLEIYPYILNKSWLLSKLRFSVLLLDHIPLLKFVKKRWNVFDRSSTIESRTIVTGIFFLHSLHFD